MTKLLKNKISIIIPIILAIIFVLTLSKTYGSFAQSYNIKQSEDGVILASKTDKVEIKVCSDNILSVHYLPNGKSTGHTIAVQEKNWDKVSFSVNMESNAIVIKTNKMLAKINKNDWTMSVYDSKNKKLISNGSLIGYKDNGIRYEHGKEDSFYGVSGYAANENSEQKIVKEKDKEIEIKAGEQGYCGGPFAWSNSGYGILDDTDGGKFLVTDTEISFSEGSKKDVNYYVIVGKPEEIMSGVKDISGKTDLFPKWAMGFTNSEWGITEDELIDIVDTYRKKQIPIDNYTLDFDWKAWGADNYGEFTWNKVNFPDASSGKLRDVMNSKGIKLTGIMKPRIHVDTTQGKYATQNNFWWTNKSPYSDYFSKQDVNDLNFAIPECRSWFFNNVKKSFDTGIVGWWNDEADVGFDNDEFMNMEKALYDGQRAYSDKRVWSLNRNFYLGSQRYAYGMWSGDINTGFKSMAMQRERMLSAINLGETKWGMDSGGFVGTPSSENYARWIEFSAFTPIFRVHGMYNQQRQPWVYGSVAEAAAKKAMQLRYKLIPYIYSYERNAYEYGVGIVRPLVFDNPNDKNVVNDVDSWMFGKYLMVSPVVNEGEKVKNIYLPEGTWIDYFNGKVYKGKSNIKYAVDSKRWADIPLFIKRGAIIPSQDYVNYVGEKPLNKVYLDVFPDNVQTSFRYYDDDGLTYDYEKGKYFIQDIATIKTKDTVSLNISKNQGEYVSELNYYICKIHGKKAEEVITNAVKLPECKNFSEVLNSKSECFAKGTDVYGEVTYVKVLAKEEKIIVLK